MTHVVAHRMITSMSHSSGAESLPSIWDLIIVVEVESRSNRLINVDVIVVAPTDFAHSRQEQKKIWKAFDKIKH